MTGFYSLPKLRLLFAALFLGTLFFILPSAGSGPALAQDDPCGGVIPRLITGELAQVIVDPGQTLRLRSAPGLSAPTSARLNPGEILRVTGGPICADGYPWWQLETADGMPGWAAEGSGITYFLAPVMPEPATDVPATAVPPTDVPPATAVPPTDVPPATAVPPTDVPPATAVPPTDVPPATAVPPTDVPPATAVPPTDVPPTTAIPATEVAPSDMPDPTDGPPTITPSLIPSPTLPVFPTAAPSATLDTMCWTAPRPRLSIGDEGVVASGVQGLRLRSLPAVGTGQERLLPPGTAFTVIEGPLCNTGYNWYQVTLADGSSGWVAEGEGIMYWVEPVGVEPPPLQDRVCLAWADNEGLRLIRSGSAVDLTAAITQPASALAISPNGRFLAALYEHSLAIHDLAWDQTLVMSQVSDGTPGSIVGWLADSSAVLLNGQAADDTAAIWQVSLYGALERLPLEGWQAAALAPSGQPYLALIRPEGWGAAVYDLSSGTLLSEYAPELPRSGTALPASADWLPDGRLLITFSTLARSGERSITTSAAFDPASGSISEIDLGVMALNQVTWSASGTSVAYTFGSGLWIAPGIGEAGTLLLPLRPGDADGLDFSLSPAGDKLLYQNAFETGMPITLVNLTTGEMERIDLPDEENLWRAQWLDETHLLLTTDHAAETLVNQPTNEAFWLLDTASGRRTLLLALEDTIFGAYALSPNGCALPAQ